jgi:hypothetical protein
LATFLKETAMAKQQILGTFIAGLAGGQPAGQNRNNKKEYLDYCNIIPEFRNSTMKEQSPGTE